MKKAFTLIELLIVVAIIAILAAIAVPNFLEAQTRAKVSRAKSDMRTLTTGVESYYVDNNKYPFGSNTTTPRWGLVQLSTPIAYITNPLFLDPFVVPGQPRIQTDTSDFAATDIERAIKYSVRGMDTNGNPDVGLSLTNPLQQGRWYILSSYGPDKKAQSYSANVATNPSTDAAVAAVCDVLYDATNGTVSRGEIFRANGAAELAQGKLLLQYASK